MSEHEIEQDEPETPDTDGPADDDDQDDDDDAAEAGEVVNRETGEITARAPDPESPEDRKRHRAAQDAVKRYAQKIADFFPSEADQLLGCPLCGETQWPGFVHLADAGRAPDVVKNAVMQFLGYAVEREYPQDPNHRTCPVCEGLGKVKTGSKVAGKETITCEACIGNGYTPPTHSRGNGIVLVPGAPPVERIEPTGAGVPDVDPSGEPRLLPDGRENPNYGKWPQYKIPVEPWGTTVGLTVQDAVA